MDWANFLHFYQPADQQADILEAVVAQSYRPLLQDFAKMPRLRLTLNINGALLELFDKHGYRDLLDLLRKMGSDGRIEFTGSAKYHALLPFLQAREMVRQISVNTETLRFYLGKAFQQRGFFPPEMAYNNTVGRVVADQGFSWIILDEIAYDGQVDHVDHTVLYAIAGTKLRAFFRERRASNLIMSAVVRTPKSLLASLDAEIRRRRYLVTAMDGETFGHHRPGLEKLLFGLLRSNRYRLLQISDIPDHYTVTKSVRPKASTWASSPEDIQRGMQFLSWSDPHNPIHAWQWRLLRLVLRQVHGMKTRSGRARVVRTKMDIALASDHFWWASAKPWWSLEMIEDGAYRLLDTLRSIPGVPRRTLDHASSYYEKIVSTAFQWQRSGKIRQMMKEQNALLRIPFKDRTVGRGGAEAGVYHAFLGMLRKLEREARRRQEYEKAILWRDAAYKLEHRHDIYDAINAIDLVRLEIPHERVEKTIARYKARYRTIRGGQPEQRGA